MKKNVAVIGMAGKMKDGVARALAARRGMMLMDCRDYITFEKSMPPEEIVRKTNITYFKRLVSAAVAETADLENVVFVSCDETVLSVADLKKLKENCVVILLIASTKAILSKYSKIKPMSPLIDAEKLGKTNETCQKRYSAVCDFKIDVGKKSLAKAVGEINDYLETLP